MVEVNWTFNALEDLTNIAEYHALQSERYAEMLVDKLLFATNNLIKFPKSKKLSYGNINNKRNKSAISR